MSLRQSVLAVARKHAASQGENAILLGVNAVEEDATIEGATIGAGMCRTGPDTPILWKCS
jgi:hypothetical protein